MLQLLRPSRTWPVGLGFRVMLYLFVGDDIQYRRLLINGIAAEWPSREDIWMGDTNEKWLVSYLTDRDHIVVHECQFLTDAVAPLLKRWKEKNIVFDGEALKTVKARRSIGRLGKVVKCEVRHKGIEKRLRYLVEKAGCTSLWSRIRKCESVTEAYWLIQLWKLGAQVPPYRYEKMPAWMVYDWSPRILGLSLYQLLNTVKGMCRIALQSSYGQKKWLLVQEALRTDHTQVSALYTTGLRLASQMEEAETLVSRMEVISSLLEEPSVPMELLYLKARHV